MLWVSKLEKLRFFRLLLLEFLRLRRGSQGIGSDQSINRQKRTGADSFEEIGLCRLKLDEQGQDIEYVEQLSSVFGKPMIRLDVV